MVFNFDMGREEYLEKMQKYFMSDADSIKSDKVYFSRYYGIDLDKYILNGRKFIIPCEMADLFCLMMFVMRSSPIYDKRRTNSKSQNIPDLLMHNMDILRYIDNLPLGIANHIKGSSEYRNANDLLQYLPYIVEKVAALLHILLNRQSAEVVKNLVDGLDELYERFFWDSESKSLLSNEAEVYSDNLDDLFEYVLRDSKPTTKSIAKLLWPEIKPLFEESPWSLKISGSTTHTLYDRMLADCFNALDRDNWPDGTEIVISDLIKKWELKYKGDKDSKSKIKDEYLRWLSKNEWYALYTTYISPRGDDSDDTDNISTVVERAAKNVTEKLEHEISQIKPSLQTVIDMILIVELHDTLIESGLDEFNNLFSQPKSKHLSEDIFLLIAELAADKSKERAHTLLKLYFENTISRFKVPGNMLLDAVWAANALAIINGEKEIDDCCTEIYESVFAGIPSRKIDYASTHKADYKDLENTIMLGINRLFTKFITNDTTEAVKSSLIIRYSPKGKEKTP